MTLNMNFARLLVAASVSLFAWDAAADLVVNWSCYIPSSRIDCAVLKGQYDARNIEDLDRQTVLRSFCDAFANWQFQPIDVSANLGGNAILGDFVYRSITLDL